MYSFTRSRLRVKIPGAGATLKQAGSETLYLKEKNRFDSKPEHLF